MYCIEPSTDMLLEVNSQRIVLFVVNHTLSFKWEWFIKKISYVKSNLVCNKMMVVFDCPNVIFRDYLTLNDKKKKKPKTKFIYKFMNCHCHKMQIIYDITDWNIGKYS